MARGCNYKPPPFLSTLSLRRATVRPRCRGCPAAYFYPRSPCGERPLVHQLRGLADVSISIHALLAESDRMTWILLYICQNFYPRSPCGERHGDLRRADMIQRISIHALLAESDQTVTKWASSAKISIHALLAESDKSSWSLTRLNRNISIHALLAESDQSRVVSRQTVQRFLSTLSLRRATYAPLWYNYSIAHFYPRSPCGERHRERFHRSACPQFLSTLSLRRATDWASVITAMTSHFYPRSPCGERPHPIGVLVAVIKFLSTLSLRRATCSS